MHDSFSNIKQSIINSHSCLDFLRFNAAILILYKIGQCIPAPSFIRSDNHPSFAVYDDHCFDFATRKHYNILDLYALLHFGDCDDFNNIIKAAEALSGKSLSSANFSQNPSLFTSQQQAFNDLINRWHQNLLANPKVDLPDSFSSSLIDYLHSRRISTKTIYDLKLGYCPEDSGDSMRGRLIIPYFLSSDNSNPVYANGRYMGCNQSRKLFPKYKKLWLDDPNFSLILRNCVWGLNSQYPGRIIKDTRVNPDTGETETLETHHVKYDFLVISEGCFDTLAFYQEGYQVASSLGCGFSNDQKKELLQQCRHFADKGQKVFICLDNDSAGHTGAYNLALFLFKNRIPFVVGTLPKTFTATYEQHPHCGREVPIKDVSDYYAAGGDLEKLILNARPGVAILAEHCRTNDELNALFQDTARLASKADLHALKQAAIAIMDDNGEVEYFDKKTGQVKTIMDKKPRFDRSTVNFLFSEACRPLTDYDIAQLTLKAHQLTYDTAGQFYEYAGGIWRAIHDDIIDKYITHSVSQKINSGKMCSVRKYLKATLAVQGLQFNTKPIWCFRNGTLWIDRPDGIEFIGQASGVKLRQSRPDNFTESEPADMSTIQMPYDYVYGARNFTWEKYVSEWMNGQQDKITLFQQMFGYVLFAANRLQKFFYWIGDGANGKSTALHVLEAVFGKDNCSSLQFHRMGSEFDTITLKNSRVNICYDAKSELGGAEEMLKAIASGDAIMAAHKGVDAETFTTNAKIFVAANKYFSASDVSRGLLRRILFLCFDRNFEGEGAKVDIEDEIRRDPGGLAGVFNWAYEGYKMLKQDGRFLETEEQKRLVEEFKTQLSPLMVFAREEMYTRHGEVLDERELFKIYREWCADNYEKTISRTKFIHEIRQVLRTDGSDIKTEKDDSRLWRFVFPVPKGHHVNNPNAGDSNILTQDGQALESRSQTQSKEAPANEQPTYAHTDVLSGDKGAPDGAYESSEALQEERGQVDTDPELQGTDSDPAIKPAPAFVDTIKDPSYVNMMHPITNMTNAQVWSLAKDAIRLLYRAGRNWKDMALSQIHNYRIYVCIWLFSKKNDADSKQWMKLIPGFDKLYDEILDRFDVADDEFGSLTPIAEGR